MAKTPDNKESWLRQLKQTSIPSFSASIKALSSVENYTNSHSSELARTILKDPNLTASVLKLANSAHFNTYGRAIRTVSRAVMILGHKSIKEVCASCLLMEQFLKNGASSDLQAILARSFHGAIQAKEIALLKELKGTEEIFISALLLGLGEISVYSSLKPVDPVFKELSKNYPISNGKERDIIGCYFKDLTLGLCRAWSIAPMIGEMLSGKYTEDSPLRCILLGNSYASSCETVGGQRALESHLKSLSLYTGKDPEVISEKITSATEETQKSLTQFGIRFNPEQLTMVTKEVETKDFKVHIDKVLQLDIIQELTMVVQERIDINLVLQQLLEGIQRGGGFQCSLVALLNPDRSKIIAKYGIEQEQSPIKDKFNFNCASDIPEIQQKVMVNRGILCQSDLRDNGSTNRNIIRRTKVTHAVWGPLIVENKVIGCFYSNNGSNGPGVTQAQLETFQLFVLQAAFFLQKLK